MTGPERLICAGCGRTEDEVESLSEAEDDRWYCQECVERLRWETE